MMYNLSKLKTVRPNEKSVLMINKSGQTVVKIGPNGQVHVICRPDAVNDFSHNLIIQLTGMGASCLVSAMFHGYRKDRHNFHVLMHHQAKATKGDILIRGVYENESKGFFSGLIKIDKTAQLSNSFFQDNVLLLDEATAVSVPTLEIAANDVKASHGSTTSKIDDDQLFYLRSRGLPLAMAKQMVINGFFQPVLERVPAEARGKIDYKFKIRV